MTLKKSKRTQSRNTLVDSTKTYTLEEAIKTIKLVKDSKFDETVSINFQLGIKSDQSDQMVRGTVSLPHGSGKKVRVVCICKGESAREAEVEGAEAVGSEDLVARIQGGWLDFDALVAHPDMMREVSKLGRVLGPKGLMPSPKTGTVTPNIGRAVKELKAGRIEYKTDKTGGLHAVCGKVSFSEVALLENARVVVKAVRDSKPPSSKGDYFRKVTIAPTQGPGIKLAPSLL
jgi:large subunit ribosomal protein L1